MGVLRPRCTSTQHRAILAQNKTSKVKLYRAHHVSKATLFRRIPGITAKSLDRSSVLILGCGTIASRVVETLAKSGLGSAILADNDSLMTGNVCRHVLGLSDLGRPKAVALKDHLLQRNPFIRVETFEKDILADTGWLVNAIRNVDLVISCVGKTPVETWVNECAMNASKPVLFCRTYAHATIGEILLARPKRCCFSCASDYFNEPDCPVPRPPRLNFSQMVDFDTDCGATFIPGSAIDVDLVSLHCARIAISILAGQDSEVDYWLVRGRPFGETENWEVANELARPFNVLEYSIHMSQCPVCAHEGAAI